MVTWSERPTRPPSFDISKYARDSETRIATASWRPPAWSNEPKRESDHPESQVTTRRGICLAMDDDTWMESIEGLPYVAMSPAEFMVLPLDHRAGFVMSLLDGFTEIDTVVELSSMHREDVVRIVRGLFEMGVVAFQ